MPAEKSSPATKAGLSLLKTDVEDLRYDVQRIDKKVDGLEQSVRRLAIDQSRLRGDMGDMESRLVAGIDRIDATVAGRLDAFLVKLQIFDRESLTLPKTLDMHGEKLRDREARIKSLESR